MKQVDSYRSIHIIDQQRSFLSYCYYISQIMPRSKSMTVAMEGKVTMGQFFLTDLKGADEVFSVESRNSAYAADRRKVVKKGDNLSRSCHDEPIRAGGSVDFSQYKQPKIRSGGRRPPRSKSFDGNNVPKGLPLRSDGSSCDKSSGSNVKNLCKAFSANAQVSNTKKRNSLKGSIKGLDKSTSSIKTNSTSSLSSSSSDESD